MRKNFGKKIVLLGSAMVFLAASGLANAYTISLPAQLAQMVHQNCSSIKDVKCVNAQVAKYAISLSQSNSNHARTETVTFTCPAGENWQPSPNYTQATYQNCVWFLINYHCWQYGATDCLPSIDPYSPYSCTTNPAICQVRDYCNPPSINTSGVCPVLSSSAANSESYYTNICGDNNHAGYYCVKNS